MPTLVVTSETHQWVCSRCRPAYSKELIGGRFRFGGEKCPTCADPGCGMWLVTKSQEFYCKKGAK